MVTVRQGLDWLTCDDDVNRQLGRAARDANDNDVLIPTQTKRLIKYACERGCFNIQIFATERQAGRS